MDGIFQSLKFNLRCVGLLMALDVSCANASDH